MQFTFAYDPTLIIAHQHMALRDRYDAQLKRCAYRPLHALDLDVRLGARPRRAHANVHFI
jgi:hypothetical protein